MDGMSRVFPVRVSPSFGLIDGGLGWVRVFDRQIFLVVVVVVAG